MLIFSKTTANITKLRNLNLMFWDSPTLRAAPRVGIVGVGDVISNLPEPNNSLPLSQRRWTFWLSHLLNCHQLQPELTLNSSLSQTMLF